MSEERSPDEILTDLTASPGELRRLPHWYSAQVAAHPNCPPDLWLALAEDYPREAMRNPGAALYALESPDLYSWQALELRYADRWIEASLRADSIPIRVRTEWLNDCVLHAFSVMGDSISAADRRLAKQCYEVRMQYANDEINFSTFDSRMAELNHKFDTRHIRYRDDVSDGICNMREAVATDALRSSVAFFLTDGPDGDGTVPALEWQDVWERYYAEEAVWQWHKLLQQLGDEP